MNTKKLNISYFIALLDGEKTKLTFGLMLGVISSALSFVPYYAVYKMLLELISGNFSFQIAIYWAFVSILALVIRTILLSISSLCTHTTAFNAMHALRIKVLKHMSKLNLGFFNNHSEGNIKTALFDDIGRLENFIAHNLIELTGAIVVPIILLVILFLLQPIMAICILIPALLGIIIPMKKMKKYPELTNEFTNTLMSVNASSNEMISGIQTLKMYNLSAKHFKRYIDSISNYTICLKKMAQLSCSPLAITVVLLDSSLLFTLPVGGYLYMNHNISFGNFTLFILLSMCFYNAFFSLINIRMEAMELKSGLYHIQEILDMKPMKNGTVEIPKSKDAQIDFNHVSFSYGEKEALHDMNLSIKPGTITAFVGASGAGKTTAAQLIAKYWEVSSGEILINGVNINHMKDKELMDLTAFVFQDVFMLEDTLYENISMGSNVKYEDVIRAAKAAQIHDFIEGLPNGYNTKIGDQGVKLSGGQMQRISIARAILKDASIIIFDEATSFSDIENERKIQIALQNLLKNKTTIMIAHRLHTIKNADNIVVFHEGKIVEQGTHDKLLENNGIYKNMWMTYIQSYGKEEK